MPDFRIQSAARVRQGLLAAAILLCAGFSAMSCVAVEVDLSKPENVERVYARKCSACHVLHAPGEFYPDEWPDILDTYGPRANLLESERGPVEAWLIEQSERAHRAKQ